MHPRFTRIHRFTVFGWLAAGMLLLHFQAPDASAQFFSPSTTPPVLEINPAFLHVTRDGMGTSMGALHYARTVPPTEIDPDARATGQVETLMFALGFRTSRLGRTGFRWRAGLLNLDIVRSPLSVGITLADYNRSGLFDLDARWINIRIGPSAYLGNTRNALVLRAVGTGGVSSLTLGKELYDGLGPEVDVRKRTYEIGYVGEAKLYLYNRVELGSTFEYRSLLGGTRPKIYRLNSSLGVLVTPMLLVRASFYLEETSVGNSRVTFQGFGGGLQIRI